MPVITDEDAPMDEQVNTATQASNVNLDLQSSVKILEEDHPGIVVAGSKRHQKFSVEDGLERLLKYPKLDTVQQGFEPKEGRRASSSSDELDRSFNAENRNHKGNVHPTENVYTHSLEADVKLHNEDSAAELDSDADSVAISPQKEISNNVLVNRIEEKESHETINKNNNINTVVSLKPIKKNSSEDNTDEPVNVISIPENSSLVTEEEYIHQGGYNQAEAHSNNGFTQEEATGSNYLYADSSQSSRLRNLKIEYNSSRDQSSQSSQSIYQDQSEDGQSIGNQVYPPMLLSQMIDHQVPSTSKGFEDNALGLTNSSSISDLAQLVVSLKCDVQKLTERIDLHEVTLKAIVHGNPANLEFLFTPSFKEKYNLKIPFTKLEDFLKFNDDLSKDQNFCREFITSLTEFIDKQVTLAKNILNMIKPYISKEVAILFNASKPAPNKLVLKDYLFCKCLLQATQLTLQGEKLPLEHEKAFMKNLGHVISGAKGWHTHNEEQS